MNLKVPAIFIALLVLGSFVNAKVDITSMSLTLSTSSSSAGDSSLDVSPGDNFYVHLNMRPDSNLTGARAVLKIYVDDTLVDNENVNIDFVEDQDYMLNISSDDFNEADIWSGNLMAYDCGSHDIKASIGTRDIQTTRDDTGSLDINADDLRVTLAPQNPSPNDDLKITVKDTDRNTLEDMDVRLTALGDSDAWSTDDRTWSDTTDSDGIVSVRIADEFRSNPNGKYQLDVYDTNGDYCKYTTTIDASLALSLSNPDPVNPMAGQTVKMRVTDQNGNYIQGATVTISNAGVVSTYTSDSQGYITLQTSVTGSFDAVASKSGYTDSVAVPFTVSAKNGMNVGISPKDVQAGNQITITVSGSDGSPIKGAKVSITQPDTTTVAYTSSDSGVVVYTPKDSGQYSVKVEATLYASTTTQFTAYNVFNVAVPSTLLPNTDITVTVTDTDGKPLSGASVSVKEASITGTTDASGTYTFSVSAPKEYTLTVKKDGYTDYTKTLVVQGLLTVKISNSTISLGNSVEIAVQDSQGSKVDAKVTITKPNGDDETLTTDEYTPQLAGAYSVSASMNGYQAASGEFTVEAYPLVIKAKMDGQKIVATATSNGNPVPNISISFQAAGFNEDVITDKNGMASVDAQKSNVSGNVTISSNEANYAQANTQIEVNPVSGTDSSMLLVILVALIIVIIVIIAMTTKGGKNRKEKGLLYRTAGGRTHLEGGY